MAIVDDDASVRVALRRLCDAIGYAATAFASGREFLERLDADASRPECLLLDIQMPGMTGIELQRELIARGERISTVVITADDAPEARARCAAVGLTDFLRKPISEDALIAAVERAAG